MCWAVPAGKPEYWASSMGSGDEKGPGAWLRHSDLMGRGKQVLSRGERNDIGCVAWTGSVGGRLWAGMLIRKWC